MKRLKVRYFRFRALLIEFRMSIINHRQDLNAWRRHRLLVKYQRNTAFYVNKLTPRLWKWLDKIEDLG